MSLTCPRCGSSEVVKSGKHYHQKGITQRYGCKRCGTTFCNEGYFRGKHQLALLQFTAHLYSQGLSYERIQRSILKQFHIKISRTTIGAWLRHLKVTPRPQNSEYRKSKLIRDVVEIGILTSVRIATSEVPEKFLVLDNLVINPFMEACF